MGTIDQTQDQVDLSRLVRAVVEEAGAKSRADKFWEAMIRLGAGLAGIAVVGLFNLHTRVLAIENTRFTRENYSTESGRLVAPLLAELAKLGVQLEETRKDLKLVTERLIRIEAEVKK